MHSMSFLLLKFKAQLFFDFSRIPCLPKQPNSTPLNRLKYSFFWLLICPSFGFLLIGFCFFINFFWISESQSTIHLSKLFGLIATSIRNFWSFSTPAFCKEVSNWSQGQGLVPCSNLLDKYSAKDLVYRA